MCPTSLMPLIIANWTGPCSVTRQAHSDSIEFICAIQKTLMYVCMYVGVNA